MSTQTIAHITGVVIQTAISKQFFTTGDVQEQLDQYAEKEILEGILLQLEQDGWVEKTESPVSSWKTGPLARKFGNIVKFTEQNEGIIPVLPDERDY